ncbi:MAG: tRNA lysidine(34) synthetase TilS [Planctomycetota bacterium]
MLPDDAPPENQHPIETARDSLCAAVSRAFPSTRWSGHPVIVGVSGGADSVALVRLLIEIRASAPPAAPLILAHCNYGLRGAASDADEAFVEELAARFRLEFRTRKFAPQEKPGGVGWESAWRELRYQFFSDLARESGARYLALAHTADDQIETVLLRLLRGSSLAGLRGIPAQRPLTPFTTVIRPLLGVRRQVLRRYLRELEQPYQTDSSNESNDFLRNRVRNQLLPLITENYSPAIGDRLLHLAEEAGETQRLLETLAKPLVDRIRSTQPAGLLIPAEAMRGVAPIIARTALVLAWRQQGWSERDLTSRHWHALAELVGRTAADSLGSEQPQVLNLPGNRVARRRDDGSVSIEPFESR